jgi:hypothetical protein
MFDAEFLETLSTDWKKLRMSVTEGGESRNLYRDVKMTLSLG